MIRKFGDTVVATVGVDFCGEELIKALRLEGSLGGSFGLVLEIPDDVHVTLEMAKIWLAVVMDPLVPLTSVVVVARAMRAHVMMQAVSLVARRSGVLVPLEAFRTLTGAIAWRPGRSPVLQTEVSAHA